MCGPPYALTQALVADAEGAARTGCVYQFKQRHWRKAMSAQYDSTKHALKAIADSLRGEVNAHGVRVLSVYLDELPARCRRKFTR